MHQAMETASSACDAMVLVVDPSSAASIEYLRKAAALVPDRVPTIAVATKHEGPGRLAKGEQGFAVLEALCSTASSIDLRTLVREDEMAASSDADKDLSPVTCGLQLELFDFWPKAKDSKSVDIFTYLTARSTQPSADNPRTADRRQREWNARMLRRAVAVGGLLIGAGAVALGVAYATDYRGARANVNKSIAVVPAKLGLSTVFRK